MRGKHLANRGMNWISPRKRVAIYMRDGLACVWCDAPVRPRSLFTLDHLRPMRRGEGRGHHADPRNLVTSCGSCNAKRKDIAWTKFRPFRMKAIDRSRNRDLRAWSRLAKLAFEKYGNFTAVLDALSCEVKGAAVHAIAKTIRRRYACG